MNPEEYTRMYELEDRYWWFVGRRKVALGLLQRWTQGHPGRVLDIGCGTGVIFQELSKIGDPVGLDFSSLALGYCRKRGLKPLINADGQALPFKSNEFDGAIGLDIFEHIKDDRRALSEAFRVLKPGGVLVLSVPAFMSLWSPHDVALMHFRRYTRPQMRSLLETVGFKVQRSSYSVFFLFPIVLLIRFLEKRRKGEAKASLPGVPGWFNSMLIRLQTIEAWLIARCGLPWGSSVIVVAVKPPS